MRRRKFLTASAVGIAGLAGCSGGSDDATETDASSGGETPTETATPTPTATPSPTPTATPTATESMADMSSPTAASETLYQVLYGQDDIQGANALYHPESPAPALKAADFEPYGGVDAIQADIQSTEVVRQNGPRATVYLDVKYSTPAGSATNTDYAYMRKQGDRWMINVWLPQSARQRTAKEKVVEFYNVLYGEDDIEGANALYHPESDAPAIEAEDFEPYGGLEAIQATVKSTKIVSDENEQAEVHAEVEYSTPAGSATNTDWFFLRLRGGAWFVDRWVPESVRNSGTSTDTGTSTDA